MFAQLPVGEDDRGECWAVKHRAVSLSARRRPTVGRCWSLGKCHRSEERQGSSVRGGGGSGNVWQLQKQRQQLQSLKVQHSGKNTSVKLRELVLSVV